MSSRLPVVRRANSIWNGPAQLLQTLWLPPAQFPDPTPPASASGPECHLKELAFATVGKLNFKAPPSMDGLVLDDADAVWHARNSAKKRRSLN
jgi:hypothetical protein